jgi:hypothetical protein
MHRVVRLTAKVCAAALGTVAITAGAAFAGINFPDPVEEVFSRLGIDLPDEAEIPEGLPEEARADDVLAIVAGLDASEMGCRFGMAVAAAASEGKSTQADDPCSKGEEGRARGQEKAASGRDRAKEASSQAPRSSTDGLEKADEASEGRSSSGLSTADESSDGKSSEGLSTADEASEGTSGGGGGEDAEQSGRDIGADAAEKGKSNIPDGAGGP